MTDPWSVHSTNEDTQEKSTSIDTKDTDTQYKSVALEYDCPHLGFEDSFIQDTNSNPIVPESDTITLKETEHQPLPDSEKYLQNLEHKLEKLKKSSKLVDALSEKRSDCLRSMLQDNSSSVCSNDLLLEFEASVTNTDSAVQNLYRQIQPVQPVTVGETVQIVKYDQLEEQRLEAETYEEKNNLPASR